MSLLMDALRKAEEAKKLAAQDAESEDSAPVITAANKQEEDAAQNTSEESAAPEMELSMAEMEEVPPRSPVSDVNNEAIFEDEEDSIQSASEVYASEPSIDENLSSLNASSAELDELVIEFEDDSQQVNEAAPEASVDESDFDLGTALESQVLEQVVEPAPDPIVAREAIELDSLENEVDFVSTSEESVEVKPPDPVTVELDAEVEAEELQPQKTAAPFEPVKEVAPRTARNRRGTQRKTARNVFAAKRTKLSTANRLKPILGAALILIVFVLGTYFYISLNQESTFNIPAGSYVTTEFVDDGLSAESTAEQLPIDPLIDAQESAASDNGVLENDATQESTSLENLATLDSYASTPTLESVSVEPPAPVIVAVESALSSAGDLPAESIAEQQQEPQVVTATIGDSVDIALSPEVIEEVVSQPNVEEVRPAVVEEPVNLISFSRQESVSTIDPNVSRAYSAYQSGALDEAELLYRQTLTTDPTQRDALLGLATIVARNGDSNEALGLYARLLARNPNDPIARAGLLELLPAGSLSEQQVELRRLLNDHPTVAALSYAYGNFLASDQRWTEAQQAYFRALQLAKSDAAATGLVNPDYAFNLAVSLEHLNQSQPAQNYYREALAFAENHPASFDLTAVRSRLASLAGTNNDD